MKKQNIPDVDPVEFSSDSDNDDVGCMECPVKKVAGMVHELEAAASGRVPEEFWQHRRAAHKEILLAVRSLVDAAIEHVDREPAPRHARRATKIPVA